MSLRPPTDCGIFPSHGHSVLCMLLLWDLYFLHRMQCHEPPGSVSGPVLAIVVMDPSWGGITGEEHGKLLASSAKLL